MTINSIANQISYRDARERAEKLYGEKSASNLYLKAIESGDDNLAIAIQEVSQDKGWTIVTTDFSNIASVTNAAFTVLTASHNVAVDKIRVKHRDGLLTDKGAQDMFDMTAKENDWAGQLDAIMTRALIPIDVARRASSMAISRLTTPRGDTQDQLLAEMRTGKAWDRIKGIVEQRMSTGMDATTTLCNMLLSTTDPYLTAAILTEGPSWLLAKGEADATDLINATLAQADPVVGNAVAGATAAGRFEAVLQHDARVVREIISTYKLTSSDLGTEGYVDLTSVTY